MHFEHENQIHNSLEYTAVCLVPAHPAGPSPGLAHLDREMVVQTTLVSRYFVAICVGHSLYVDIRIYCVLRSARPMAC